MFFIFSCLEFSPFFVPFPTYTLAFSLYTERDIDSDDSHAHSSCVLHSPLSGSSVNASFAQDTEQIHGKNVSGALLKTCVLLVLCLLNEWSSLANLWTSGARRLLSERVWNSLVVATRSHVWKLATVSVCLWRSETAALWKLFELSTLACDPTRSQWKTQYERCNSK